MICILRISPLAFLFTRINLFEHNRRIIVGGHRRYFSPNQRLPVRSTRIKQGMSSSEVTLLKTAAEKDEIAPSLAKLAAPTEMSSYGVEQWKFLLDADNVEAIVISKPDNDKDLLGCVLKIVYGPDHEAFGMMLVSKEARGRGLAKKLLGFAMGSNTRDIMKILGTCTELGRPMYEKMGFQRVSTVTKLSIKTKMLDFKHLACEDCVISVDDYAHLTAILAMDKKATGLDRSPTLIALNSYPYVKCFALTKLDKVAAAAFVTQHTGSSTATVGPILGEEVYVPVLLQGIKSALSDNVTDLGLIVSDHPSLVASLKVSGFEQVFELGAMTMDGKELPGDRDTYYMGLIHPTLG